MGTYLAPKIRITDDYQEHRNRKPPSGEPGTDYALPYGSPIYAPEAGKVIEVKHTTSGAGGRWVTIALNDGRTVRLEHNSRNLVTRNKQVKRGDLIAKSGASAKGREWGVGPHVHIALWDKGKGWGNSNTIDFEKYVGEPAPSGGGDKPLPTPTPTPKPPKKRRRKNMTVGVIYEKDQSGVTPQNRRGAVIDTESGKISPFSYFPPAYADALAVGFGLEKAGPVTKGQFDALVRDFGGKNTLEVTVIGAD